jgi:hypothetical protein
VSIDTPDNATRDAAIARETALAPRLSFADMAGGRRRRRLPLLGIFPQLSRPRHRPAGNAQAVNFQHA